MSLSKQQLISALDRLAIISQVPLSIINEKGETEYCLPFIQHHYIPKEIALNFIDKRKKGFDDYFPLMVTEKNELMTGVIPLNEELFLFVGPVSTRKLSFEEINDLYEDSISNETRRAHRTSQYIQPTTPLRFANILSVIALAIHEVDIPPVEILNRNYESIDPVPIDTISIEENFFLKIEEILFFELNILSAIENGNTQILGFLWDKPSSFSAFSSDSITDFKTYIAIPYLTLMCYAAQKGGAVSQKVFSLFNEFIQEMNLLPNVLSITSFIVQCSYSLCDLVRKEKGLTIMPSVLIECEKYINNHIQDKITAEQLAKVCGLSKRSLYTQFKNNYGMTINEYIQKERIRRAKTLLEATNYSMVEIASAVGYCSQSHFIQFFKEIEGCTPSEYQKKNKRTV